MFWDFAFGKEDVSDYCYGQRVVMRGGNSLEREKRQGEKSDRSNMRKRGVDIVDNRE